eukprot:m.78692 g.78692  ORF g.78692 m.78692 type:complete len:308 (+) comp7976_c0_seq3:236-1159(+)
MGAHCYCMLAQTSRPWQGCCDGRGASVDLAELDARFELRVARCSTGRPVHLEPAVVHGERARIERSAALVCQLVAIEAVRQDEDVGQREQPECVIEVPVHGADMLGQGAQVRLVDERLHQLRTGSLILDRRNHAIPPHLVDEILAEHDDLLRAVADAARVRCKRRARHPAQHALQEHGRQRGAREDVARANVLRAGYEDKMALSQGGELSNQIGQGIEGLCKDLGVGGAIRGGHEIPAENEGNGGQALREAGKHRPQFRHDPRLVQPDVRGDNKHCILVLLLGNLQLGLLLGICLSAEEVRLPEVCP